MASVKECKNAVREVRKEQKKHFDKAMFCKEHNMHLSYQYHIDMEKDLGQLAISLEIILNTGYVSHNG